MANKLSKRSSNHGFRWICALYIDLVISTVKRIGNYPYVFCIMHDQGLNLGGSHGFQIQTDAGPSI